MGYWCLVTGGGRWDLSRSGTEIRNWLMTYCVALWPECISMPPLSGALPIVSVPGPQSPGSPPSLYTSHQSDQYKDPNSLEIKSLFANVQRSNIMGISEIWSCFSCKNRSDYHKQDFLQGRRGVWRGFVSSSIIRVLRVIALLLESLLGLFKPN